MPPRQGVRFLGETFGHVSLSLSYKTSLNRKEYMFMYDEPTFIKEALRVDFEETARWRRSEAAEYPEDLRNLEAAALLDKLAASVESIAPDLLWRQFSRASRGSAHFPLSLWCSAKITLTSIVQRNK